ncbi:MAG: urease accessory protein UreE [Opitutaceae bacterium]|nr:urease accessory protein UreE [Opitutaceae bacterium]
MLTLIHAPLTATDAAGREEVALQADRMTLAKRLWRGSADDGTEFGFQLATPLKHGDTIFESPTARYVIRQAEEPVVEISLDIAASASAGIGWAIGNLHLELSAEPARLLAPDEPAVRQLLERLKVPYRQTTAIFRPGRFSRGNATTHELGHSHTH